MDSSCDLISESNLLFITEDIASVLFLLWYYNVSSDSLLISLLYFPFVSEIKLSCIVQKVVHPFSEYVKSIKNRRTVVCCITWILGTKFTQLLTGLGMLCNKLEYVDYYNERRLHWALDIDNYEKPLEAFHNKTATEAIRKSNPKWMEEEADVSET